MALTEINDTEEMPPPEAFEGLHVTVYCPRHLDDCESLNFIIARGHTSFICCGERHVPPDDEVPQDKYRVCFRNGEIDDMQNFDKRDIIQTAAVLMGAAAVIEERDCHAYHNPPDRAEE